MGYPVINAARGQGPAGQHGVHVRRFAADVQAYLQERPRGARRIAMSDDAREIGEASRLNRGAVRLSGSGNLFGRNITIALSSTLFPGGFWNIGGWLRPKTTS